MGSPTISHKTIWPIYRELLHRFENLDEAVDVLEQCQVYFDLVNEEAEMEPPSGTNLLGGPDHRLEDGSYYMGGVNNGLGLGMYDLSIIGLDIYVMGYRCGFRGRARSTG